MAGDIKANAEEDLNKWNCAAMYPPPVKTSMNPFTMVMGIAKEGFAIFN